MTPARRTVATYAAAVLAVAVIGPAAIDAGHAIRAAVDGGADTAPVYVIDHRCDPFAIVDTTPAADVADLMAQGWIGDPTDGRDAIYPPGCVIVGR